MEITKPERIHIIIEEENQYSVLLLNCYPTAVTVAVVLMSSSNRLGADPDSESLQRDAGESLSRGAVRGVDLADRVRALHHHFRGVPDYQQQGPFPWHPVPPSCRHCFGEHRVHQDPFLLPPVVHHSLHTLLQYSQYPFESIDHSFTSHPFIVYLNSLLSRLVDASLLMLFFLLACGWQITHQLLTVPVTHPSHPEKRDPIRNECLSGTAPHRWSLLLLRLANRRSLQQLLRRQLHLPVHHHRHHLHLHQHQHLCWSRAIFSPSRHRPCCGRRSTIRPPSTCTSARQVSRVFCGVSSCTSSVRLLLRLLVWVKLCYSHPSRQSFRGSMQI